MMAAWQVLIFLFALPNTASAQGPADPFFSADLIGFVRVIGVFGSMMTVIIGLVVKLTTGKFRDDLRDTRSDVAGIGKKVDEGEKEQARLDERQQASALAMAKIEAEQTAMRQAFGRLEGGIERIERAAVDLQGDIMKLITESMGRVEQQIRDLAVEVARLQERDKLAVELRALREGRSRGDT